MSHSCSGQEAVSRYSSPDTDLQYVDLLLMLLLHLLQLSIQAFGHLSEPRTLLLIIPNLRVHTHTHKESAQLDLISQAF